VLQRGEKLDNLVERSTALSAQSKMFYKTAKKVHMSLFFYVSVGQPRIFIAKLLLYRYVRRLTKEYALYLTFHMYKYPVDNLQIFD